MQGQTQNGNLVIYQFLSFDYVLQDLQTTFI
jgi:hypothetical protein